MAGSQSASALAANGHLDIGGLHPRRTAVLTDVTLWGRSLVGQRGQNLDLVLEPGKTFSLGPLHVQYPTINFSKTGSRNTLVFLDGQGRPLCREIFVAAEGMLFELDQRSVFAEYVHGRSIAEVLDDLAAIYASALQEPQWQTSLLRAPTGAEGLEM